MGTHPIFESDFDCLTDMGQVYSAAGTRWGMPTICEPGVGPDKDKPIWSVDQTYRDNSGSFHNPMMSSINNMILAIAVPWECEVLDNMRKNAMDRQIHMRMGYRTIPFIGWDPHDEHIGFTQPDELSPSQAHYMSGHKQMFYGNPFMRGVGESFIDFDTSKWNSSNVKVEK